MLLVDDAQDFDVGTKHVIEYTNVCDAQPALWLVHLAQALDPAPALPRWLVLEMRVDGISHGSTSGRWQRPKILMRLWREGYAVSHSGHIMAL